MYQHRSHNILHNRILSILQKIVEENHPLLLQQVLPGLSQIFLDDYLCKMLVKGLNITKTDINHFSKKEGYLSHLKYIGDSLHYCTKPEVKSALNNSKSI
jgi:hypothetical protein